jgi:hypothetical protein
MTVSLTTFRDHLPTIAATLPAPAHLSHDICQIDLLADRIASLDTGSTHKVYRDWRFAVLSDAETEQYRASLPTESIGLASWEDEGGTTHGSHRGS